MLWFSRIQIEGEVGRGAPCLRHRVFHYVGCLEHTLVPEDMASCCHGLPSFVEDVGHRIPEADVVCIWRGVLEDNHEVA